MHEAALTRAQDVTLDEPHADDEGTLAAERAAAVVARLAADRAACRAWIATSCEVGRLLHAGADLGDDPDAFLWDTPRAHARRWIRRRLCLRPRRFVVLLIVLPLKGRLVRHLFRAQTGKTGPAYAHPHSIDRPIITNAHLPAQHHRMSLAYLDSAFHGGAITQGTPLIIQRCTSNQ